MRNAPFPPELNKILGDASFKMDTIGLSDSQVVLFTDKVLKIQPDSPEARTEYAMMTWLSDKLPVPKCLYHTVAEGTDYLLMSKVEGAMACEDANMRDPKMLVSSLAGILRELWRIDVSDCPVCWDGDRKLSLARTAVEHGTVDLDNVEPDTFGPGGFDNPRQLLTWLYDHKPEPEPVLSHGDFCLPNIFLENGRLSGLIDLGRSGVADRWVDIAICYRSLRDNYSGAYGGRVYPDFDPNSLFTALGIEPNWEKIRYFLLLDELF